MVWLMINYSSVQQCISVVLFKQHTSYWFSMVLFRLHTRYWFDARLTGWKSQIMVWSNSPFGIFALRQRLWQKGNFGNAENSKT